MVGECKANIECVVTQIVDIGDPDFVDKIGDETVATTAEELVAFLQKVDHPALKMPSIL